MPGEGKGVVVNVSSRFTGLRLDKERNVEIGNAHFILYRDGDGDIDGQVGCGVNVQVEDRQPQGSRPEWGFPSD